MAGGEGLRLRPFTYAIPKPLLPVGNSTILGHAINELKKYKVDTIYITVNFQNEKFIKWRQKIKDINNSCRLIKETKKFGTAGAIQYLDGNIKEPFILLNADLLFKINFSAMMEFHMQSKSFLTIGMKNVKSSLPYAVLKINNSNSLMSICEKPKLDLIINSGIYILDPGVIKLVRKGEKIDMPDLIQRATKMKKLIKVFDIGDKWLDLGQIEDYESAIECLELWEKI